MSTEELLADEHCIGLFGDERLSKNGILLFKRVIERETVCLRGLCDNRAEQRRVHRFLEHSNVTWQEIIRHGSERTAMAAAGRHVLAIQDTSEFDFSAHQQRTAGLGPTSGGKGYGLFLHPVLAVDAENNDCLGIAHLQTWVREIPDEPKRARRPIEEKESMRWLDGALGAAQRLQQARLVTVVADRESDIYEEWDRVPDGRVHLLTRAHYDRQLEGGGTLFQWLEKQPVKTSMIFDVPARAASKAYRSAGGARSKARTAHQAHIDLRFGQVKIKRPVGCHAQQASIALSVVEVRERPDTVPPGEEPVHWILLTSHDVQGVEQALQIVAWYKQRWQIEQLFRTLKRQGLGLESSQLEEASELLKLTSIATLAAVRTLQLVNARDNDTGQPASDAFDDEEIDVLGKLQEKFQGKTARLKNPFTALSMAWVAWIIARLGGWTGSPSEARAGPITMLHGLQRFDGMMQGWRLAKMWG
jgi:hypothetical protein